MGTVLVLALSAAVYPQLLAVVVLILTRPDPRPLLWACCVAGVSVNAACGIAIYAVFRAHETIAGTSSSRLGPAAYLVIGGIALVLAIFVWSRFGRKLMSRGLPGRGGKQPTEKRTAAMRARAERRLEEGSLAVAVVVGAMLAVPGPFDLLAFGRLARGGYGAIVAIAAIVAFALIKFVLIEVPIASYALDPDGTSARVDRFSGWLKENKLVVIAIVLGVIGIALLVKGISAAVAAAWAIQPLA